MMIAPVAHMYRTPNGNLVSCDAATVGAFAVVSERDIVELTARHEAKVKAVRAALVRMKQELTSMQMEIELLLKVTL